MLSEVAVRKTRKICEASKCQRMKEMYFSDVYA